MNNLQRTEDWHQARSLKISGSRIASVMGLPGAFQSRKQLMEMFIKEYQGYEPEPVPEFLQVMFDWGNEHEEDCEEMLIEAIGGTVRHYGFIPHPTIDYVGMSPDGVLTASDGKKYLVEYKCPFMSKIPDEPPAKYVAQIQLGMEVMDIDDAILAYWWINNLGDPKLKWFHVERDTDWWAEAEDEAEKFWQEFLELRDKPLTEVVREKKALELAGEYVRAKKEAAAWIKHVDDLKQEMKAYVGEGDTQIGQVKVTHVTRKGGVDREKLEEQFNIDLDDFRKDDTHSITFSIVKTEQ